MKAFIPAIIRDSADCRAKLLKRFPHGVPPNVKLFSIDAVGTYSNIDTNHAKNVMTAWFNQCRDRISAMDNNFPFELALKVIYCVMSNNIIQFGDTFWKQPCGTAMGTSTAVNHANFYVGILELSTILDKCKDHLSFYGRFIDDGIGTWTQTHGSNLAWHQFLYDFNHYGILKWTNTGMVNKVIFLDMVMSIDPLTRLLSFKSYSKESNLCLCTPPKSAHQPKMLRGMIIGRLLCFYDTNSNTSDFLKPTKDFFFYLVRRGHDEQKLMPLFEEACARLDNKRPRSKSTDYRRPIYFHIEHHPRGLQSNGIRAAYNRTTGKCLTNRNLTISVSRPKNLRDRSCNATSHPLPHCDPSNFT